MVFNLSKRYTKKPFLIKLISATLSFSYLFYRMSINSTKNLDLTKGKTVPAIVIGSGLTGLTVTDTLLNKYNLKNVVLVEKFGSIGGNSIKASSGISVSNSEQQHALNIDDHADYFYKDLIKSYKLADDNPLLQKLSIDCNKAMDYLNKDIGLSLDKISQLGGHSKRRTHKSSNGMPPGFEMISSLKKRIIDNPNVDIQLKTKLVDFNIDFSNGIKTCIFMDLETGKTEKLYTDNLILATGGFSRNKNLIKNFLEADISKPQYKASSSHDIIPKELILKKLDSLPTSNGEFATGDLLEILLAKPNLNFDFKDLAEVQIHPSGFIDPKDPDNPSKILAGEQLRGNGGILINPLTGARFVNELDTRDKVTFAIFEQNVLNDRVFLILSEKGAEYNMDTIGFYQSRGLIKKIKINELYQDNKLKEKIVSELRSYSILKNDRFGRDLKMNLFEEDLNEFSEIYVAEITPILHYTMGGISINEKGLILDTNSQVINNGLYCAGEQSGGVHGKNRLGGCSLLESVVYGLTVGNEIGVKYKA